MRWVQSINGRILVFNNEYMGVCVHRYDEVGPLYFTARSKFKAGTAGEIPFYTAPLS
jgi:hypothetical protein